MVGPANDPEEDAEGRRWVFSPRLRVEHRREEPITFRQRLVSALRVGHGLGVPFRLELESGPAPRLHLRVRGPVAEGWVARTLASAYGALQWTRGPTGSSDAIPCAWTASRRFPWPHPLRQAEDGSPLMDAFALAAASSPSGLRLVVAVIPHPAFEPSWWERIVFPPPPARAEPARSNSPRPPEIRSPAVPIERTGAPLFWDVRVGAAAVGPDRSTEALPSAVRAFERVSHGGSGNGLVFRPPGPFRRGIARSFPVSDGELGLLLPGPECPCGGASSPENFSANRMPLGRTRAGLPIGPEIEPDQGRHLAILGETGMGKSSLVVSLASRARRHAGVVLFDPLGETAEAFAEELARTGTGDAVRIDPGRHPLRINALEGVGPNERDPVRSERRRNDLVHAFRRVRAGRYVDAAYWGPRLEEMLTRALTAAAALEHGTLSDAHTLLATGARVHRELPSAAMAAVRELGDRIRDHPQDAEGARRLLYEVVRSPVLERMLCARDPELAPPDLVVPGRTVVLSGEAARVGESTARYLLSTYLALLWSELLARPVRTKVFVVLDEAQWFSHESLAEMLRLGRRANVHVVLATQAIASLAPESVREAAWTNVADFVTFRGSPDEAREFSRIVPGLAPELILSLPRGHAAALLGKGRSVEWIRSARLPGPPDRRGGTGRIAEPRDPEPGADLERPEGTHGADPPVVAGGEPDDLPGAVTEAVAHVFRQLRRRASVPGAGPVLRVPIESLGYGSDPADPRLRAAGSALGRAGALLDTPRTARGRLWLIAVDRILPGPAGATSEGPGESSGPPKPS